MDYRFFAWDFSYFSAKVRAYLRYKQFAGELQFEEILATREVMEQYLLPATGSIMVPQIEDADGLWLQDSSHIIDELEARHPRNPVVPTTPRQRLTSYIVELLADEWLLPWAFWERWHYSLPHIEPNHGAYNAQQWGAVFAPGATGEQRRDIARTVFRDRMKIDEPEEAEFGPYAGIPQLGVTAKTEKAWTESARHILSALNVHYGKHDYLLGGRPSLGDFALMGPLYAHLYKDPVTGFMMRTEFPFICEWIERCNGSPEAGSRSYSQTSYKVEDGQLKPFADASDDGDWFKDDQVTDTVLTVVAVFFDEMWPVLKDSISIVRDFLASDLHDANVPIPGRSFFAPPQLRDLQTENGPLVHEFELRGTKEQRMVSPYQIWMLGRMSDAMQPDFENSRANAILAEFLAKFQNGEELLGLPERLIGSHLRKEFDLLYAVG